MAASRAPWTLKKDAERLGVDMALFQEGLVKPFREHRIVDPSLYIKKQRKQTHFTETTLLGGGGAYGHQPAVSVEVIHRGDTAPLLDIHENIARVASVAYIAGSWKLRALEAQVRSGEHFLAAKRPREALLTLDGVLRDLSVFASDIKGAIALESRVRCGVSHAALRLGHAGRARDEARNSRRTG